MIEIFQTFVNVLTNILFFAIFARAILSWFPTRGPNNPIVALLYQVTEPILKPLRAVIPPIGGMDLTPLVALIVLLIIRGAVSSL